MAVIKSALELAMERASSVKIDKKELKRKDLEQKGKEASSQFLNNPKYDFAKWVSEITSEDKQDIINGSLWVFIKNINLPLTTADVDKLIKIKSGLLILSNNNPDIEEIFTQLMQTYQQYIDTSKTLFEQNKQEYAPVLHQKAMQLGQQTGQMVPIEPETDRDFLAFHKEKQNQLDEHFKTIIKQITDKLETII